MKTVRFTKRTANGQYSTGDVALLDDDVADGYARDGYGVIGAADIDPKALRNGDYSIDGKTGKTVVPKPVEEKEKKLGVDHTRAVDEDAVERDEQESDRISTSREGVEDGPLVSRSTARRVIKG